MTRPANKYTMSNASNPRSSMKAATTRLRQGCQRWVSLVDLGCAQVVRAQDVICHDRVESLDDPGAG
jgi:hypothetical protein